ncbi:MAG: lytic transglycosylase domain-containing protein [Pseudomonadales bacterium]|nr:lytic transglycosylase domain-containing protein [Pseudomonadales bacterium]
MEMNRNLQLSARASTTLFRPKCTSKPSPTAMLLSWLSVAWLSVALLAPLLSLTPLLSITLLLNVSSAYAISTENNSSAESRDKLWYSSRFAKQREIYQLASKAVKQDPNVDLATYLSQLEGYPLQPYLEYQYLSQRFSTVSDQAIRDFLQRYPKHLSSQRLRANWLMYLGRQSQWQRYQAFKTPADNSLSHRCFEIRASLSGANDEQRESILANQIRQLWLRGATLPSACRQLEQTFENSRWFSQDIIWQRFEMAYRQYNNSLAKRLLESLSAESKMLANRLLDAEKFVDFWLIQLTQADNNRGSNRISSASYKRLLKKIAAVDHLSFAGLLDQDSVPLLAKDRQELKILSAWYFAKFDAATALDWMAEQKEYNSFGFQKKTLRYTLQAKRWFDFKQAYERADANLRKESEWRYWYAKSLWWLSQDEAKYGLSQRQQWLNTAEQEFSALSYRRGFYGLLAAQYVHRDHSFNQSVDLANWPIDANFADRFAASIELLLLDDYSQALREWVAASKGLSRDQWRQTAALAYQLGWHERMLRAIVNGSFGATIAEQYPLAFIDSFSKQASTTGIDISWLLAMSRQESGFAPLIRSSKGATGVMQLMPATAQQLCRELELDYDFAKLKDADFNIMLGSYYVKQLLDRYEQNYILATAAYNAGPHRVDEWLSLREVDEDWAHWVATIPYRETRKYVQSILAFSHYYQQRLPASMQQDLKLTLFWHEQKPSSPAL